MSELARRRDAAMNRRRLELGLTWRQVATATETSYETLRAIRKGETGGGELSLRNIERGLRWAPGAFAAIDAGREPEPFTGAPVEREADAPTPQPPDSDWQLQAMKAILEKVPLRDRPTVLRRVEEMLAQEEAQRPTESNTEQPSSDAM